MRTNPASFIPDLEEMLCRFEGKYYKKPGTPLLQDTHEGTAAVLELIEFLKTAKPVKPLEWDDKIALASRDHVLNMASSGATGHTGQDGSTPFARMARYTKL
jgi:uncharacterized protein YkwD